MSERAVSEERRLNVPTSFLRYRDLRYLRVALGLVVVSLGAYIAHDPGGPPNGGTWLGYSLGGVSAALIVWLLWLGVVKRQYGVMGGTRRLPGLGNAGGERSHSGRRMQAWTSAHVYLGTTLLVLVPLHAGFQFGWNVHTLAFALMCGVIGTGVVGVALYSLLPTPMARNRSGQTLEALLQQVADVDAECKKVVADLPDEYAHALAKSLERTRVGGGLRAQLARRPRERAAEAAVSQVRGPQQMFPADAEGVTRFLELLSFKQSLLDRIQRHVRFRALLELWLLLHVPLAFATLAALIVHVFVVFYYW